MVSICFGGKDNAFHDRVGIHPAWWHVLSPILIHLDWSWERSKMKKEKKMHCSLAKWQQQHQGPNATRDEESWSAITEIAGLQRPFNLTEEQRQTQYQNTKQSWDITKAFLTWGRIQGVFLSLVGFGYVKMGTLLPTCLFVALSLAVVETSEPF